MRDKIGTSGEPERWTAEAFLDHFHTINDQMHDRRFAFILGAGASVSSRIKSGLSLVNDWLEELHKRDPDSMNLSVEDWATAENLEIDDFDYDKRAEFYPQVYDRRFFKDREEGYAYIENVMKDAKPSLGYSMLAQLMTKTRHSLVITTNFDNLIADAVLLYTDKFAQVCGHESLTGFVRATPRRPLVAKIHRDVMTGPQSDQNTTRVLHEDWARTLRPLFKIFTPVFIGYGGNDGSLMNFLDALEPGHMPGGMFWCYRLEGSDRQHFEESAPHGDVNKAVRRIKRLVARQSGRLVSIIDFDIFMTQLALKLGFTILHREVERRGMDRATKLREGFEQRLKHTRKGSSSSNEGLQQAYRTAHEMLEEAENALLKDTGDWWAWELKAQREPDPAKRVDIYHRALKALPNSSELMMNLAVFLHRNQQDKEKAEAWYRKAYKLNPDHATMVANFALFLTYETKNHDEAERLHRRALELDPKNARITGNYATFLTNIRKDYGRAEALYRKTLELDSENLDGHSNYTAFLLTSRRFPQAASQCERACKLCGTQIDQATAESWFYRALLLRMTDKPINDAIGRLRTLIDSHFKRGSWSFDGVLEVAKEKLKPDDYDFLAAVAAAILDEDKVPELDKFPQWRDVEPVALDTLRQPLVAEEDNEK